MKRKIVVLGCGRVGTAICADMAREEDCAVVVVDASEENLASAADIENVALHQADLSKPANIKAAVEGADLVIGTLPGPLGFNALKTVIECGKPYCDTSFMPEDCLQLNDLAKEKKVTAVVDCGVAPGLSNLAVGYVHSQLDRTDRVEIYAGGLPKMRLWPYEYKAPFSPGDVIEEYTRPARMVEYGELVSKPALSDRELIDFPEIGTLEAFNTDGLRSLLTTIKVKHMVEKTLRYPGHVHLIRALRDTGFFDTIHVDVGGVKIKPLDLTKKLLFPHWAFEEDEEEFTVVRVIVEGEKGNRHVRHAYELYDEYDKNTGTTSMARAVGFTCAIIARLILRGEIADHGVLPPELLGSRPGVIEHLIKELGARGVYLMSEVAELSCVL